MTLLTICCFLKYYVALYYNIYIYHLFHLVIVLPVLFVGRVAYLSVAGGGWVAAWPLSLVELLDNSLTPKERSRVSRSSYFPPFRTPQQFGGSKWHLILLTQGAT